VLSQKSDCTHTLRLALIYLDLTSRLRRTSIPTLFRGSRLDELCNTSDDAFATMANLDIPGWNRAMYLKDWDELNRIVTKECNKAARDLEVAWGRGGSQGTKRV
jgi:hypothetical protein